MYNMESCKSYGRHFSSCRSLTLHVNHVHKQAATKANGQEIQDEVREDDLVHIYTTQSFAG